MKKIYLSACLVVLTVLSFAQTTKKDSLNKKDSTNIIRKKLPAIISLASATSTLLSSYEAPNNLLKLTPPNVASMEQYGNLPINFSTGQLNYSTPLYNINVGDNLNIPIQLLYNNTGLKPYQVPTWVGNGWDLGGFGSVVQYVKGIDDFSFNGLQNTSVRTELSNYLSGTMTDAVKFEYSQDITSGNKDSQYDVFSFNMLGRNGKFYFDGTNVIFFNYMPLKVTFNNTGFTITDERGFVFRFALSINNAGSFSDGFIYSNSDPFIVSTKTWYLTKITTPSGVDVVFNYTPDIEYAINTVNTSYSVGAAYSNDICIQSNSFTYGAQSSNVTVGQYLPTEILWKGKKVTFETVLRDDLKDGSNNKAKALSKIKAYNESNTLIKQIGFDYGAAGYDRLQ